MTQTFMVMVNTKSKLDMTLLTVFNVSCYACYLRSDNPSHTAMYQPPEIGVKKNQDLSIFKLFH
jgi:hypothetical protein